MEILELKDDRVDRYGGMSNTIYDYNIKFKNRRACSLKTPISSSPNIEISTRRIGFVASENRSMGYSFEIEDV